MNYTVAHYVDQAKLENAIRRDIENDPVRRLLVCIREAERKMIADARARASKIEGEVTK